MSIISDKATGIANEVVGRTKQAVGDIIGDRAMHIRGFMQEKKGIVQRIVGTAKSAVKKIVDKT